VDPAVLADYVARSGLALPIDQHMVAWLLELAEAAERQQPERGAHWCAAALRRLPPTGPQHARALAMLLSLVMQTGQYELLREVLTRYATHGCAPVSSAEIRIAAVFVALYTGEPPAEDAVRALLDAAIADGDEIGFGEWWFGRRLASSTAQAPDYEPIRRVGIREPMSLGQIGLLRAALSGDPDACGRAWREVGRAASAPDLDRLRVASAVVDLAEVARIVLGPRYRVPERGVLGVYHRVVREYTDANWSMALSAVHELELSGCGGTLAHHAARLFAAEICAGRGQDSQARDWLADAAPVPRLAALRAWVEIGLLASTGQERSAVALARRVCRTLREAPSRPGLDRLLIRAVWLAELIDDREGAAALLADIEDLHRRGTWTDTMEIVFMARGLVHRDAMYTQVAADLARRRGNRPALLEACLAVARLAEDPRPWLREAHEIAGQCGASALLDRVRAVTRERGVSAPRPRGQREALSATEQRIIELIKDGLTNRQIALDLRVSEKTVENRLTRLFARTGCRSRVELATASLEGRLVPVAS
jgi:DNA-binding CsgD family transcriptional regulator